MIKINKINQIRTRARVCLSRFYFLYDGLCFCLFVFCFFLWSFFCHKKKKKKKSVTIIFKKTKSLMAIIIFIFFNYYFYFFFLETKKKVFEIANFICLKFNIMEEEKVFLFFQ